MNTSAFNGSLYDADYFTWTQQQADALRRLSVRPDNVGLDLDNLTEEVESLGRSQVDAVESALFRLPEHAALAEADSRDRRRWSAEMAAFRLNANRAYRPLMRQPGLPEA